MSVEYVCDGCGKRAPGVFYPHGTPDWHKPEQWFQRQDEDGPQDACCRRCIDVIAAKSGKTRAILPMF